MTEQLEVYDMQGILLKTQDREEFYDEIKQEYKDKGEITKKVKSIRLLLLNSSGRIFLQKRSKAKSENAGLYDKSVGGHVKDNDSYELTVVKECAEELGFPATILSKEDFVKASKGTDLNIVGIFREVDFIDQFMSMRMNNDGSKIEQPFLASMYIGYYDGPIKFVDGESSGIEVFSLDELEEEIEKDPDKFTQDIKFMINKYKKYLVSIK